ncbi:protein phosphatase 1B [Fistulifera solaris]|uniref:protein-serine/threonine phosphatase n=1 Tax=Fistulifera solaris TaxID=1519565 RepID=A0A1Z5KCM1_FISSO|nr:protein phosphatase 1B [Fistulifera solaris]|eukprot:GAX24050.1 protein phosphatase 1B [Fistulifera solaris]
MGNSTSATCTHPFGNVRKKQTDRGGSQDLNIQCAVSEMKGYRLTMEDTHIHAVGHIPVRGASILTDHSLFGVFDGHGGDFTSQFLAANFMGIFSRQEELMEYLDLPETGDKSRGDVNGLELLQAALTNTFFELDEQLRPLQEERTEGLRNGTLQVSVLNHDDFSSPTKHNKEEKSGSTAVIVLVTPSHILCANTGDSRAILRRSGQTLPLSMDHKPSELPERLRIHEWSGFVKGKRVNGDLSVSRAFGDFVYKDNGDPLGQYTSRRLASQQKVIVTPDFMVYPRNDAQDEFILLACDGVWDVVSNQQLSEFVCRMIADGEVDLGNICEECLDTCLDRQSRDNMTIMLVSLPGIPMDHSSSAALNNAIWGTRTARQARHMFATPCTSRSLSQSVEV